MAIMEYVDETGISKPWVSGGRGRPPKFVFDLIESGKMPDFRTLGKKRIKPRKDTKPTTSHASKTCFSINIKQFAKSLNLTKGEAIDLLCDGRIMGHLAEPNVARVSNLKKHPEGNRGHDLGVMTDKTKIYNKDNLSQRYSEVRVMSGNKVSFLPNRMLGQGREFNENIWLEYIKTFKGWYICDSNRQDLVQGKINYYFVDNNKLLELYNSGKLGKETKISRDKFFELGLHLLER